MPVYLGVHDKTIKSQGCHGNTQNEITDVYLGRGRQVCDNFDACGSFAADTFLNPLY